MDELTGARSRMNWIEFNSFELAQLSEFGLYSASL